MKNTGESGVLGDPESAGTRDVRILVCVCVCGCEYMKL